MATQTLYTFKANLQDLIKLQVEIDKATAKLRTLKKTDREYKAQQAKVKNLGASFNQQAKAMSGATAQANKMNTAGGRLVNTFKSAAVAIGAAFAVRAIIGSIKSVISTFSEFEQQMAAVKAISGATEDEFKQLEKTALRLGASTVFTATEVAKLQEEYARLGFTVSEIDAATVSTLNLASATGESLSSSAQIAGSTLRAFNLDAEQTQRVTDVMAQSFTNSALNLDRFKESMKFVAPVARATGFTLEETSSLLMQLSDNGISGSIAGNALKNIFLKLGDANSKLAKTLGGPVQGIPELAAAMRGLADEGFSATEAVDLLDKRSAPAFLALIKNIEGLENGVDILNNAEGAVNRMSAIRLDTLQGDFTILKSATEGLQIALGEQFDINLRNIVFSLTNFIQKISQSDTALKTIQTVVQLVSAAIVGLTARFAVIGFGAVIKGVGGVATGMIGLARATVGATASTKTLKAAFMATPWGLVAQLVTTVAASYFLLGEEASEAEMKQLRLNKAMNDATDSILAQNDGTKERAASIRQFVNDFPQLLKFLDLERASNVELAELRTLLSSINLVEIRDKIEANKSEISFKQSLVDSENELLDVKRKQRDEEEQGGATNYRLQQLQNDIYAAEQTRNIKLDEVKNLKRRNKDMEAEILDVVNKLKLAGDIQIEDGETLRSTLSLQYLKELADFRKFNQSKKKETIEANKDRLQFLQEAVNYYDITSKSIEQFGSVTEQAQERADASISDSPFKTQILSTTTTVQDLSIELSELRKFVSNLDGIFIRGAKATKPFVKGIKTVGFALNKTKDQFKKLSELLDDLVDNEFESALIQAKNKLDVTTKSNDEQISLMTSNKDNIIKISDDGNKKEIAALIKANKGKFAAIKTLTVDQYKDAIDGEKGNKDEMLKILQAMLSEEDTKLQTAFAYKLQIYASYYEDIQKIENERKFSFAGDIAEGGEQEARDLERNELNFFKAMKLRRNTRETFAEAEITFTEDEAKRKLKKIQELYGSEFEEDAKYRQQKLELEQETQNKINSIRQDGQDENVKDQLAAIEKIGQYYGRAFEAFSTFFNNKMELEKQKTNEFYTAQSDDLNTSMERELEAVEGNAEAEEDVRERYSLLQEANEEKKQQELRKIKKKQFQVDKANDIATAIINGALAMTKVSAQTGMGTFVFSPIIAGLVAAQIAAIASQKFIGALGGIIPGEAPKFAKGGMVHGASHANGGVKFAVGGRVAELEGGEAVINKRSTAMFRTQLSDMNAAGGGVRFADGGIMPGTSNILQSSGASNSSQQFDKLAQNIVSGINAKEVTVSEASITSSQSSVAVSELTANIF